VTDGLFRRDPLPDGTEEQPEQVEPQQLQQCKRSQFDPDEEQPPLDDQETAEDIEQCDDEEGGDQFDGAPFSLFGREEEEVSRDHDEESHGAEMGKGGLQQPVAAFWVGEEGLAAEVVALDVPVGEADLAEEEHHPADEQQRAEEGKVGDGVTVALVHG